MSHPIRRVILTCKMSPQAQRPDGAETTVYTEPADLVLRIRARANPPIGWVQDTTDKRATRHPFSGWLGLLRVLEEHLLRTPPDPPTPGRMTTPASETPTPNPTIPEHTDIVAGEQAEPMREETP